MNALKPCRYLKEKSCAVTHETCLYWANLAMQQKCETMILETIDRYRGSPQRLPRCTGAHCSITGGRCCFSGNPALSEDCHNRVEQVWSLCEREFGNRKNGTTGSR